jgi:opacity protein-like surface antigen
MAPVSQELEPPTNPGRFSGHFGVQQQFGNIVLGVEANLDSMFKDKDASAACPNPLFRCNARVDDIASIGGRLGGAAGHYMPYLTGGYANAGVHFNNSAVAPFPFLSTEEGRTRNGGWYIGAGVEWIVSPNWTAGIEYRHYDFGDATSTTFTTQAPQGVPIESLRQDLTTDSLSARVSWKFNRDVPPPAPLK